MILLFLLFYRIVVLLGTVCLIKYSNIKSKVPSERKHCTWETYRRFSWGNNGPRADWKRNSWIDWIWGWSHFVSCILHLPVVVCKTALQEKLMEIPSTQKSCQSYQQEHSIYLSTTLAYSSLTGNSYIHDMLWLDTNLYCLLGWSHFKKVDYYYLSARWYNPSNVG